MTRRSFIKGLLALPAGLMLGVKGPDYDSCFKVREWVEPVEGSQGFWDVPLRAGLKGRPLKSTDYEAACKESQRRFMTETYFAPSPMFESLEDV